MRLRLLLLASFASGALAANSAIAQYRGPTPNAVAKHPHFSPPTVQPYRHGSIGGPTGKTGGIGELANKGGGINGTVKPKF
jgi:hypothetical protein